MKILILGLVVITSGVIQTVLILGLVVITIGVIQTVRGYLKGSEATFWVGMLAMGAGLIIFVFSFGLMAHL